MKSSPKSNKHVVDLLFTLALFCVFAASSLMVVLIGATVYKNSVKSMTENYDVRTSLTYLSQKMHQNDFAGGVILETVNEKPALVFEQEYSSATYQTWIYYEGGYIKELFTKKGNPFKAEIGSDIIEASDFNVNRDKDGIFTFTVTDTAGKVSSIKAFSRCSE